MKDLSKIFCLLEALECNLSIEELLSVEDLQISMRKISKGLLLKKKLVKFFSLENSVQEYSLFRKPTKDFLIEYFLKGLNYRNPI